MGGGGGGGQTQIATYRLDPPRGRCSENISKILESSRVDVCVGEINLYEPLRTANVSREDTLISALISKNSPQNTQSSKKKHLIGL